MISSCSLNSRNIHLKCFFTKQKHEYNKLISDQMKLKSKSTWNYSQAQLKQLTISFIEFQTVNTFKQSSKQKKQLIDQKIWKLNRAYRQLDQKEECEQNVKQRLLTRIMEIPLCAYFQVNEKQIKEFLEMKDFSLFEIQEEIEDQEEKRENLCLQSFVQIIAQPQQNPEQIFQDYIDQSQFFYKTIVYEETKSITQVQGNIMPIQQQEQNSKQNPKLSKKQNEERKISKKK